MSNDQAPMTKNQTNSNDHTNQARRRGLSGGPTHLKWSGEPIWRISRRYSRGARESDEDGFVLREYIDWMGGRAV